MKLKTIAKLFGAAERDATLPSWFRWYLDHMPVRENVYGTLVGLGLNGTQANVIIERIWPQVAFIQQEAIDLAKAGNESGAIAKLNAAASLAERLAREAAEHERLLGRGIEPEPPRAMEERDMAAQYGKADWPRQVVERDNYILINDYLGAGFAQAHPELVEELTQIAADYLAARPAVAFDGLWAYTYDALKKMYPARRRGIEVGGGVIEAAEDINTSLIWDIPMWKDIHNSLARNLANRLNIDEYVTDELNKLGFASYDDVREYMWQAAVLITTDIAQTALSLAPSGLTEEERINEVLASVENEAKRRINEMIAQLRVPEPEGYQGVGTEELIKQALIQLDQTGLSHETLVWIEQKDWYPEALRAVQQTPYNDLALDLLRKSIERAALGYERSFSYKYKTLWPYGPKKTGGGMVEASTIAKMFGANTDVREPTTADFLEQLNLYLDGIGFGYGAISILDDTIAVLQRMWDKFLATAWETAKEKHPTDAFDAFSEMFFLQRADVQEIIHDTLARNMREISLTSTEMENYRRMAEVTLRDYIHRYRPLSYAKLERLLQWGMEAWEKTIRSPEHKLDYDYALIQAKQMVDQSAVKQFKPEIELAPFSEQIMKEKTGGGIMSPKLLSLRSILMAAASLGDLLSLLRKVKEPTKEVTAAIKKLEGMVAKYDEGAKLEDVGTASMKRILANLKKVPKPTADNPRTRVLKSIKLLEDLLKTKVSSAVLQASIVQVARILKAVEEPTEEVKAAIKLADQLAKSYEEGGPQKYGKVVSVEGMTKLLKMLEAIEEKPDPVVKAVAALKKLLGAEEEKAVVPGERGELPSYGLAKLETALKPGVYRARLIRAGEALDGTTWPEEQLKIAFEKGYFEGVPVNAISYTGNYGPDIEYHLPLDTEIAGKVVGNQVGFIKDAKWDDEEHAGYGFVYITETERRNLIDAMLEQGIDTPGMSIYADGMKDENDIVTGINGVTSMDLVTFPAADGAILSQALTSSVKEWGEMRKKLRTAAPEQQDRRPWTQTPWPKAKTDDGDGRVSRQKVKIWVGEGWEGGGLGDSTSEAFKRGGDELADKAVEAATDVAYAECQRLVNTGMDVDKALDTMSMADNSLMIQAMKAALKAVGLTQEDVWREQVFGAKKTGGGIMSPTALEQRLDVVEKISQGLNERVAQADVDGMIEMKLQASKLPDKVQAALRGQLLGKQLTEAEVDSFIKFQQGITDDLATELAATAHVTLGGGVLPGEGKDTLEGALTALFEKQK